MYTFAEGLYLTAPIDVMSQGTNLASKKDQMKYKFKVHTSKYTTFCSPLLFTPVNYSILPSFQKKVFFDENILNI